MNLERLNSHPINIGESRCEEIVEPERSLFTAQAGPPGNALEKTQRDEAVRLTLNSMPLESIVDRDSLMEAITNKGFMECLTGSKAEFLESIDFQFRVLAGLAGEEYAGWAGCLEPVGANSYRIIDRTDV